MILHPWNNKLFKLKKKKQGLKFKILVEINQQEGKKIVKSPQKVEQKDKEK